MTSTPETLPTSPQDLNQLVKLRQRLAETGADVRFDSGTRAAYASEASNYRQMPLCVVLPRTIDELVSAVRAANEAQAAVLPRGAGTSMCGQSVNTAVVLDHSMHLNSIISIDKDRQLAIVEPGVVCDQLNAAAAQHGLAFGPDPATHSRCTLGGMIGNNSCGAHSVRAGKTAENVERLDVLTVDGERFWVGPTDDASYQSHLAAGGRRADIVRALKTLADEYADAIRTGFPTLKRRVSGYSLDQLLPENGFNIARALVGSEGTCVTVLQAEMRLIERLPARVLVVYGFPDIYLAADAVPQLLPLGAVAMEGLDTGIIGGLRERGLALADIAELPDGSAWLMVEFGAATQAEALAAGEQAQALAHDLPGTPTVRLCEDEGLIKRLWSIRETGASATSMAINENAADPVVGWEDAAVEPAQLGAYLREFAALVERYGYVTNLYGHFGDGCVHARITFNLKTHEGIAQWRAFLTEAAHLVVRYGGSLSGEHGDGQAKGELLPIMYPPALIEAFRAFKRIWDPHGRMNPGKLIDAHRVDENLRLGPGYRRNTLATHFRYPSSDAPLAFARETERCVGMGKCRSLEGGAMCPSYRATRDEAYSTRGRARLLFEALSGDTLEDGWNNDTLKDALDLCLACKSCKTECPTHVDMATYKSEYLAKYYTRNRRPLLDTLIGRLGEWLPLAARASRIFNSVMRNPLARSVGARAGFARNAAFPELAATTFRKTDTAARVLANPAPAADTHPVLLWTDTFNSHFSPEVLESAVRVLEGAGFHVELLSKHICCGRPYYDAGMLEPAKRNLLDILGALDTVLARKIPLVVLEPSCLSVFRDELRSLLPDDDRAHTLAALACTLGELLAKSRTILTPDVQAQTSTLAQKTPARTQTPSHAPANAQAPAPAHVQKAYLHGHCHQKACGGMGGETALLTRLGIEAKVLSTGCCGMAGAYGYQTKTAGVAAAIGATEFKPHLDELPTDACLITDGFSCRSQALKVGGRKALHLAQFLDPRRSS
jgi:FAD/FMN-containing dehydrogenase/Fe-S oxidoreductase